MAVTVEDLRNYVGAPMADDAFLTECLATSNELLTTYIGKQFRNPFWTTARSKSAQRCSTVAALRQASRSSPVLMAQRSESPKTR